MFLNNKKQDYVLDTSKAINEAFELNKKVFFYKINHKYHLKKDHDRCLFIENKIRKKHEKFFIEEAGIIDELCSNTKLIYDVKTSILNKNLYDEYSNKIEQSKQYPDEVALKSNGLTLDKYKKIESNILKKIMPTDDVYNIEIKVEIINGEYFRNTYITEEVHNLYSIWEEWVENLNNSNEKRKSK